MPDMIVSSRMIIQRYHVDSPATVFIYLTLFILLTAHPFAHAKEFPLRGETGKKLRVISSSSKSHIPTSTTEDAETLPPYDMENPQAKGIILTFGQWPETKERTLILDKTTSAGLTMAIELTRFKTWVFEWPELENAKKALEICDALSVIPSLEYCEPDYLLAPAKFNDDTWRSQTEGLAGDSFTLEYTQINAILDNVYGSVDYRI